MSLDQAGQSRGRKPDVRLKTGWSFFGALLWVVLSGCETMNGLFCGSGGQRAVQELVYFGTATPSGSVTSEGWAQFLSETVSPVFLMGCQLGKRLASGDHPQARSFTNPRMC